MTATYGPSRSRLRRVTAGERSPPHPLPRQAPKSDTSNTGGRTPNQQEPRSRDYDAGRGRCGRDLPAAQSLKHPRY